MTATRQLRSLGLLCLWLFLAAPLHAAAPEPFKAVFAIRLGNMTIGESERSLTRLGKDEYLLSAQTRTVGLAAILLGDRIKEESRFRYAKGRPQAAEYRYLRSGGKKRREIHVSFDWSKRQASGEQNGQPWQVALKPGVADGLLYQYLASFDLQGGRRELRYLVADEGELKPFDLAIEGEETLDTPLGALATVKIHRLNDKRDTTLWMARELGYLPVRIEHVETDGRRYRADIKAFEGKARR